MQAKQSLPVLFVLAVSIVACQATASPTRNATVSSQPSPSQAVPTRVSVLPTATDPKAVKSALGSENKIVSIRTLEASAIRDTPIVEIRLWLWPDEVSTFKAEMPQLYIGEKEFGQYRYTDYLGTPLPPASTHELVFIFTPQEFAQMMNGARVTVRHASESWNFGPFDKNLLDAKPAMATLVPPALNPSFSLTITPTEQTLPAGAATTFFVSVPQWDRGWAPIHWSVTGMPSGVTTEFLPDASPANSTLVLDSPCALPQGNYTIEVRATISQTVQSVKATVNIIDRLMDTRPDSVTSSFATNLITTRRGGPSTVRTGPARVLTFCESAESRTLIVRVLSAMTETGTSASEPPRFTLLKSLVWPAPASLQTVSGGYRANAREVANSNDWDLKWKISNGMYVLAFLRSPFEASRSADKRLSSVGYRLDIMH